MVGTGFNTPWFDFPTDPLQHWQRRHAEQHQAYGAPLLHPAGILDISPLCRIHLEEYSGRPLAVAFVSEKRERRSASARLGKHGRPFHRLEGVGTVG